MRVSEIHVKRIRVNQGLGVCVCQTSTKAQIDISLLFPKVVSKVDLANKRHESTNNGNVIDDSAHSAPALELVPPTHI